MKANIKTTEYIQAKTGNRHNVRKCKNKPRLQ